MSSEQNAVSMELAPALVTEAAAWVARLHGPYRSALVEQGFRRWLEEDPDHQRAFELVTESWDEVGTLRSAANIEVTLPSDAAGSMRWKLPFALAAGFATLALVGALLYFRSGEEVSTTVGEQRVLTLNDGSRVSLNTATNVAVDFSKDSRRIRLKSGEALFEVVKDARRPFVVIAGDREITALGTAFLVRRDADQVAVTLVEGKVAIGKVPAARGAATEELSSRILAPGERITFSEPHVTPKLDRPTVDKLMAWQRGKVPIENLSLAQAVAEMNRYSVVPLVVERSVSEQLRVSGIFRAGDSLSFARAVAQNYGLQVEQRSGRIVIGGTASGSQ